jgi:hypothetical protein
VDEPTRRTYLLRLEQAQSVRELREIADELRALHADDPDAERLRDQCFTSATDLIAVGRRYRRPDDPRPLFGYS